MEENQQSEMLDEKGALQELVKKQAEHIEILENRIIRHIEEIARLRSGLKCIIDEDDIRPHQIKDHTLRQLAIDALDPNRMKISK